METFKETRSDLDWVSFQSLEVSFTRCCWLTGLASGMIRGKTDFFRKGDLSKPLLSRAGLAIPLLPRPRLNIVVGWLHCRSLQTADLACCRECKVVVWKSVFIAAGASWLKEDRQWGLVDCGWLAERSWQEVPLLVAAAPFTFPPVSRDQTLLLLSAQN